ncbi:hypothetical protein JDN40_14315 [Rhodomicrobium vannielii ATCC 17100]|uniref:LPD1 domain-containing protein n=1 Tax=Rhodomicrobium vannielii TaxID=1069 RepID=UPI001919A8C0|nr:LPD1 domain-containing protein [Rhodomicrobium vannielii]MBJ7535282.1 hypothetical protein [Rhodomicrobium vannielii ATCC 17100]
MFLENAPQPQVKAWAPGGEPSSLGEIYDATVDSLQLVDNANSYHVALSRAYDARNAAIKRATNVELWNPADREMLDAQTPWVPEERLRQGSHRFYEDRIKELQRQFPEAADAIRADRPVLEDAKELARQADRRATDVWERGAGGIGGAAAWLAGGLVGTFSDPINVGAAALFGPYGTAGQGAKGLLWYALKSGAANAGAEAVIQPAVQAWRAEAGLDHGVSQAALNTGLAFLFGAGVDLGIRAPVRGVHRALRHQPVLDASGGIERWIGRDADPLDALDQAARRAPEGSPLKKAVDGDEAALRDIAKATGADADPAVRGALQTLDNDRVVRLPVDDIDESEHLTKLADAMKRAFDPEAVPPGDAIRAPKPAKERPDLTDDVPGKLGDTLDIDGKPVVFRAVDPKKIETDADTFQFKSKGDSAGVTERLRGVTKWDPLAAGKAVVYEYADGRMVIADGHQRLGLAKRLAEGDPNIRLHAYVFREADGFTPADVRAYAALKNMKELSGTPLDMAKVMRERPDLVDGSLPLSDGKMREAVNLSRLSDEAFGMVVNGHAPASFAALLGDHVLQAHRHAGLLKQMMDLDPGSVQEARLALGQLLAAPQTSEHQLTLFGSEVAYRSMLQEKIGVLNRALNALKKDKRIFGLLDKEAGRITEAGNKLAEDVNTARADEAARLSEVIEQLATRSGVVADALNDATASIARGVKPQMASRAFLDRMSAIMEKDGVKGLMRESEARAAVPERLDDPHGPDAENQIKRLESETGLGERVKAEDKGEATFEAHPDQGVMFAIPAWHGSPHNFDRFDINKIGTGEGAQAFGHGLYFAENKGVAESYQESIGAGRYLEVGDKRFPLERSDKPWGRQSAEEKAATMFRSRLRDRTASKPQNQASVADINAGLKNAAKEARRNGDDDVAEYLEAWQRQNPKLSQGNLYEVSIEIEPEELIDYDKEVLDQPQGVLDKIMSLAKDVYPQISSSRLRNRLAIKTGASFLDDLAALHPGQPWAVSDALKKAGIPGIRYLDAASRGSGEGTRNIVIFDDKLVKIVGKDGKPVSDAEREKIMFALGNVADSAESAKMRIGKVLDAWGEDDTQNTSGAMADHAGGSASKADDGRSGNRPSQEGRSAAASAASNEKSKGKEKAREDALLKQTQEAETRLVTSLGLSLSKISEASPTALKRAAQIAEDGPAMMRALGFSPDLFGIAKRLSVDIIRLKDATGEYDNLSKIRVDPYADRSTFGHEWWHAFDNYFGSFEDNRRVSWPKYMSDRKGQGPAPSQNETLARIYADWHPGKNVRPEVAEAFDGLFTAIFKGQAKPAKIIASIDRRIQSLTNKAELARSSGLDGAAKALAKDLKDLQRYRATAVKELEKEAKSAFAIRARHEDIKDRERYWAEPSELTARAFQAYIVQKLGFREASNELWQLPRSDKKAIFAAFDKLFATVKTRETPNGLEFYALPERRHTPRDLAQDTQVRAAIDKALSRVLPPSVRREVRQSIVYGGREVDGYFDPYAAIVRVSMAAENPQAVAFHEAGHALRSLGLLDDVDFGLLWREAEKLGLRKEYDIDGKYGEAYGQRYKGDKARLEDALREETVMHMLGDRLANGRDYGSTLNRILDPIIRFLRAVAEAVRLRERTAADVIADVGRGRLARREASAGGERGTRFAFAGEKGVAHLARNGHPAIDDAVALAKSLDGLMSRDEIWKITANFLKEEGDPTLIGVFKGVDGKWRVEVDDSALRITDKGKAEWGEKDGTVAFPLRDVVENPSLTDTYPEMSEYGVKLFKIQYAQGFFDGASWDKPRLAAYGPTLEKTEEVVAHELQHGVQEIEGFAPGGSSDNFERYMRFAGETEARNVEKRLRMTPDERRQTPPWETQDRPDYEQILLPAADYRASAALQDAADVASVCKL